MPLWYPPVVFVAAASITSVPIAVLNNVFAVPITSSERPWWLVIVTISVLWMGLLASVAWANRRYGPLFERDFFVIRWWKSQRSDLVYLLVGVAMQVLVWVVYLPFQAKSVGDPTRELLGSAYGWRAAVICLTAGLGAPIVEEIFFRGLLLTSLQGVAARWFVTLLRGALPIIVSGLLFAAAHFEAVQFAGLAITGSLLAVIRTREGRIAPSIFAHAGFNSIALIVALSEIRPSA